MALIAFLTGLPWATIGAGLYFLNAQVLAPSLAPPSPDARFRYRVTYRLSSVMAGNYGHATNATDPKVKP